MVARGFITMLAVTYVTGYASNSSIFAPYGVKWHPASGKLFFCGGRGKQSAVWALTIPTGRIQWIVRYNDSLYKDKHHPTEDYKRIDPFVSEFDGSGSMLVRQNGREVTHSLMVGIMKTRRNNSDDTNASIHCTGVGS